LKDLASRPPLFLLPPANASHVRSYLSSNRMDPTMRQRIFDAFVVIDPTNPVLIGWPGLDLNAQEASDLDALLVPLNYLGRSESWIQASRRRETTSVDWNCRPETDSSPPPAHQDVEEIPVACPKPPTQYHPLVMTSRSKKGGSSPSLEWIDALSWSTNEVQEARMNLPPAMSLIIYTRLTPPFGVKRVSQISRVSSPVYGVEYVLTSRVLPSVTTTLEVAERVRRKLMGIHKRLTGAPERISLSFSGKNPLGKPATGHVHAFYLPLDRDGDGLLDHLLVVCGSPLDKTEEVALSELRTLWQPSGRPDIAFTPLRYGTRAELLPSSHTFLSVTPFVPSRHFRKGRGDFEEWLRGEVRREAHYHSLPAPVTVTPLPHYRTKGRGIRWLEFRRNRRDDAVSPGYGFRLEFDRPVNGPFSLGYACHFGLGLFVPSME
jgi:CRISPR-associated protein Csb2